MFVSILSLRFQNNSKTIVTSPIIYKVFSRNGPIYDVAYRNSISAFVKFYLCFDTRLEIKKKSLEIDLSVCYSS